MKISFTVQSVSILKDLIHLRLKNNDLSDFRPDEHLQPVVKGVPPQVTQMALQIQKGIQQAVGQTGHPISLLILTEKQYETMGRPTVKDCLQMEVSKEIQ